MKLLKVELDTLLEADFNSGLLFWKERDVSLFEEARNRSAEHICNLWNSKNAGREAFTYVCAAGYKVGTLMGKQLKAHRVIWCLYHGEWPSGTIDHINHNKCDNRISNLRDVDISENMKNLPQSKFNTSGYPGVDFAKANGKYRAQISVNGVKKHLGYFPTPELASERYQLEINAKGFHKNHGAS